MDLTEAAIDHIMLASASERSVEYSIRSRGRVEIAHPRAHITENRVNDAA